MSLPLCIDLDGTLLRINSLYEATFSAVLADWRLFVRLPRWLAADRAHLKQELSARWSFAAAYLPYNEALVRLIELERAQGRRIVLCTAADVRIANAVAAHLGLFDDVIASDGTTNLRGGPKAVELCRRFGGRGFVYAGNDDTDFAVWRHAAVAVVVNASPSVARGTTELCHVAAVFDDRTLRVRTAIRALRPASG